MDRQDYVVVAGHDPWAERNARARFRDQVAERAKLGHEPESAFNPLDVQVAFEEHPEELAEIRQVAAAVREKKLAADERRQAADRLWRETDRVLAEWDKAEAAERRKRAEVEARKRLGIAEAA